MKSPWPLMENNITESDLNALIAFLKTGPILTQSSQVAAFEQEWSSWLGVKHSVFLNSGASANILTMAALKAVSGIGEVIVSPFGWISDIVAVIINGFEPVFVDIDPKTLCIDNAQITAKLSPRTKAVLMTHAQGFGGLTETLLSTLREQNIPLIEDVCESHGACFGDKKLGTFGLVSNFSYYYAHHMSTIEGGMVCTDDNEIYQIARMLRSHGMVREASDPTLKAQYEEEYPDLNPDFIFAHGGFNMRNTEIGAVIGRNQLPRLDLNNEKRRENFALFLDRLDAAKYRTDFAVKGSCNYAFNLILKDPDDDLLKRVIHTLRSHNVEFRRGSAGGGNQLRQPYLKKLVPNLSLQSFPIVEHVHFYGFYIGNYPGLAKQDIIDLASLLNRV